MDDVDAAAEHIERERAGLLARRKPVPSIDAKGSCWYCDTPLFDGRRWCDAECRDADLKKNKR